MPKKEKKSERIVQFVTTATNVGFSVLKFLALIFFAFIFIGMFTSVSPQQIGKGNVAVIPIDGIITTGSSSALSLAANSKDIVELIEEADKEDKIKAILLEINSPGGAPVATDEIASAAALANKTVVAVIRETGASGAYWVATAADRIFANRMSVTGSIGVTASGLEFSDFITEHNITYRRLVAGKYKDVGTPWRALGPEEQKLYQDLLDTLHEQFIGSVAKNRNLPESSVRELATGWVYLGAQAKELGLVDEIGGRKEALLYIEKNLNITAEPVEYSKPKTFFEELTKMTSEGFYSLGQGIGSSFSSQSLSLT